ncbi:hypothetical protein BT63DRAFT_478764 [Microthyrium microscopicum]|uniref:Uncharacterized protein n=1 Tax=Microthyrium microscopicum TaxID=703497 RepID=A0A6A6UGS6_9PEZI|nr:hypothetical protein BT63DRAFT_478764 [Microthyrium microscopicum]
MGVYDMPPNVVVEELDLLGQQPLERQQATWRLLLLGCLNYWVLGSRHALKAQLGYKGLAARKPIPQSSNLPNSNPPDNTKISLSNPRNTSHVQSSCPMPTSAFFTLKLRVLPSTTQATTAAKQTAAALRRPCELQNLTDCTGTFPRSSTTPDCAASTVLRSGSACVANLVWLNRDVNLSKSEY